jgi:pimeloyl-ACP methyl ester carboxylesterase
VPIGFARHVRERLPAARHCELACGHVPQLERPAQLHSAITRFLRGAPTQAPARTSRSSRAA